MKLVIFDIDGTLTNTVEVDDRCFMAAFYKTFGIAIRDQNWEDLQNVTDWGITEEIVERNRGQAPSSNEYERMITNLLDALEQERSKDRSQFKEVAGAKDFFTELVGSQEFEVGIATGAWERSARLKLETAGIDVNGVCFANSNHHKSREAITRAVIQQLTAKTKEPPEEIIYVGDGAWDYRTCQRLGIRFIGMDAKGNGRLKALGADPVFRDYLNPVEMMRELRKAV